MDVPKEFPLRVRTLKFVSEMAEGVSLESAVAIVAERARDEDHDDSKW